jgi:hypothetical protein
MYNNGIKRLTRVCFFRVSGDWDPMSRCLDPNEFQQQVEGEDSVFLLDRIRIKQNKRKPIEILTLSKGVEAYLIAADRIPCTQASGRRPLATTHRARHRVCLGAELRCVMAGSTITIDVWLWEEDPGYHRLPQIWRRSPPCQVQDSPKKAPPQSRSTMAHSSSDEHGHRWEGW